MDEEREKKRRKKMRKNEEGRRKQTVELPRTDVSIPTIISAVSGDHIKFHEIYD
jgi:hypothetical protein